MSRIQHRGALDIGAIARELGAAVTARGPDGNMEVDADVNPAVLRAALAAQRPLEDAGAALVDRARRASTLAELRTIVTELAERRR